MSHPMWFMARRWLGAVRGSASGRSGRPCGWRGDSVVIRWESVGFGTKKSAGVGAPLSPAGRSQAPKPPENPLRTPPRDFGPFRTSWISRKPAQFPEPSSRARVRSLALARYPLYQKRTQLGSWLHTRHGKRVFSAPAPVPGRFSPKTGLYPERTFPLPVAAGPPQPLKPAPSRRRGPGAPDSQLKAPHCPLRRVPVPDSLPEPFCWLAATAPSSKRTHQASGP